MRIWRVALVPLTLVCVLLPATRASAAGCTSSIAGSGVLVTGTGSAEFITLRAVFTGGSNYNIECQVNSGGYGVIGNQSTPNISVDTYGGGDTLILGDNSYGAGDFAMRISANLGGGGAVEFHSETLPVPLSQGFYIGDHYAKDGLVEVYHLGTTNVFVNGTSFNDQVTVALPLGGVHAWLYGGPGANTLGILGTPYNDVIKTTNGSPEHHVQGNTEDSVTYDTSTWTVILDGGDGKDTVVGGSLPETVNGGTGRDRLFGGGANDTLNGGSGRDRCVGGSGRDTFQSCEIRTQ